MRNTLNLTIIYKTTKKRKPQRKRLNEINLPIAIQVIESTFQPGEMFTHFTMSTLR